MIQFLPASYVCPWIGGRPAPRTHFCSLTDPLYLFRFLTCLFRCFLQLSFPSESCLRAHITPKRTNNGRAGVLFSTSLHLVEIEDHVLVFLPVWLREHSHNSFARMWWTSKSGHGSPSTQACDLGLRRCPEQAPTVRMFQKRTTHRADHKDIFSTERSSMLRSNQIDKQW